MVNNCRPVEPKDINDKIKGIGVDLTPNLIDEEILECLKNLIGCEILSQEYEDCVYVNEKHEVIRDGKVIDKLDTKSKIEILFDEYCEQEGI